MDPIFPHDDWNLAQQFVNPSGWGEVLVEPPSDAFHEVTVVATPPSQENTDDEPFFFIQREIEEMLNDI
ncbi:hypothetical protein Hanom_Chr06g00548371 [Helianthus anomalus]